MCSNTNALLIRVCLAIDELASRSVSGEGGMAGEPGEPPDDEIARYVAAIWAMVADADPELARRLPGYLSAGE
jgi:hypothetical protein